MKVVWLCKNDWANMSAMFSKSLNKVGVESRAFSMNVHKFNYPEKAEQYNKYDISIKKYIESCDVIIFIHSYYFDCGVDLSKKGVAVLHAGSSYRQNNKNIIKVFNPIVDITFVSSDLLGFKPKNEVCYSSPIDTDYLKPVYMDPSNTKERIISHYPTSPKGYEVIQKVLNELKNEGYKFEFKYDPTTISYLNHIKRCSECDIYIEDMSEKQGDIPLTSFGMTSLECASLGKVTCTRYPDLELYEKLFGKCGINVTNTGTELKDRLKVLLSLSNEEFIEEQKKCRKWIEERHSLEVIGNWFKNEFKKIKK